MMVMVMMLMIGAASGQECARSVQPVPSTQQVAWISPTRQQVGTSKSIEVVSVRELRSWARENQATPERTLQMLGMIGGEGAGVDGSEYKITIFDVKSDWLCRPLQHPSDAAQSVSGVAVCARGGDKSADRYHALGYTGCGYAQDTVEAQPGLDVYRLTWGRASSWGFCVMPLKRFLEGA